MQPDKERPQIIPKVSKWPQNSTKTVKMASNNIKTDKIESNNTKTGLSHFAGLSQFAV
jgi:hypothetical protein